MDCKVESDCALFLHFFFFFFFFVMTSIALPHLLFDKKEAVLLGLF